MQISPTSLLSCLNCTSYAVGNDLITTSAEIVMGRICVRASSRRRLFNRLRSTIEWLCFATTIPSLIEESRESAARTSRCSVRNRLPALLTRSRSAARVSLRLREYPTFLRPGVLTWQPDRKLLSPLFSAATQDLSSPPCRHPLPKTMRPNTALVSRTVSWLTH